MIRLHRAENIIEFALNPPLIYLYRDDIFGPVREIVADYSGVI
jgi:hypothetical protein